MYVGVSSEDSLLSTQPASCVTLWLVSSAFHHSDWSSNMLENLVQIVGSLLNVWL